MKREADTANYSSLPSEKAERLEAFARFLGQELMHFRHNALTRSLRTVSDQGLESMPTVERAYYQRVKELSPEAQETCQIACEQTLNDFAQQFLTLLMSHARNWPLGTRHGLNYRLFVEVVDLPKAKEQTSHPTDDFGDDDIAPFDPPDESAEEARTTYGQVLETIDLSSDALSSKHWYRWLNKFGRE